MPPSDTIEPVIAPGGETLGTLRLRHEATQEIILVPAPSQDPADPLNWPTAYKYYVAGLISWAIFLCTFFTSGPAITIPQMTIDFFGPPGPSFLHNVAKTAYFFTVTALMMGVSNLIWAPLMVKYGRRPTYIASFTLYAATSIWSAVADSYSTMLVSRALMGFAAGAGEVLGPLTIADIFFVHQRGTMMVLYTCMLNFGSSLGTVIAGLITINRSWRVVFWVSFAFTGATAILMFLTLPETLYVRNAVTSTDTGDANSKQEIGGEYRIEDVLADQLQQRVGKRPSFMEIVSTPPFKQFTNEPVWKVALRPIILICLPSVLWASLVLSVVVGFLVAISSNLATAFSLTYNFYTWQTGLCLISGVIGSIIAIFFGGYLSDACADYLTRRNGGIREPEMRLPLLAISLITGPLSLVLYGVGIGNQLHWIVPVIGLGLLTFTIVQAANISVVYMIDCYRPIAGEITVTQYAFKSLIGFLLSFYTNPWIEQSGYAVAFGEMAAIFGAVLLGMIPFYFYGKTWRRISWNWPVVQKLAYWHSDRDVGE